MAGAGGIGDRTRPPAAEAERIEPALSEALRSACACSLLTKKPREHGPKWVCTQSTASPAALVMSTPASAAGLSSVDTDGAPPDVSTVMTMLAQRTLSSKMQRTA